MNKIISQDFAGISYKDKQYLEDHLLSKCYQGDVFICLGNDFLSEKQFVWDGYNKPFNMSIPLLNVGQMFEILLGCSCIDCTLRLLDERVKGKIYGMELCEALWELIKEYFSI